MEQNPTNMPRSTRKKSKTGTCHVMLRVNTESPVHWASAMLTRGLSPCAHKGSAHKGSVPLCFGDNTTFL